MDKIYIVGGGASGMMAAIQADVYKRQGVSHIQFVIGGSLGLHEKVSKVSGWKLSFSRMTFPHQLMRVILLEQIYRGYRIINGEPYHK